MSAAGDAGAVAEAIVFDWIRSDACSIGLKMMLDRGSVQPLIDAVAADLAAARAEVAKARQDALEEAARIANRYANRPFDPIDTYGPAIEKTAAAIRRDILKARTAGGSDAR